MPCRAFVEIVLCGDRDPVWFYIFRGFVFGFSVVNPTSDTLYTPAEDKKKLKWESNLFKENISKTNSIRVELAM